MVGSGGRRGGRAGVDRGIVLGGRLNNRGRTVWRLSMVGMQVLIEIGPI